MKNQNYLGEFKSWADVHSNYDAPYAPCPADEPAYVFAEYEVPGWEGYSTVITSTDAETFSIVAGSHCSCYGLEGQWLPTQHRANEIGKMMEAEYGFFHEHKSDLEVWIATCVADRFGVQQ